jgi:PadR family transcriptional regulator, regulatory protein PadR
MAQERSDLLQGTLDMLILKAVEDEAVHGFGISVRLRRMSREVLQVEQGSLYPALYRLEDQGLLRSEWGVSENNRKARFYALTAAGRRHLKQEAASWSRISTAVNLVLGTVRGGA